MFTTYLPILYQHFINEPNNNKILITVFLIEVAALAIEDLNLEDFLKAIATRLDSQH